ncbi:SGNH/GDSL hydrolase family protein [Rhizobium herbae]|uniref:Lysophospholipase L1-like esterase n=1 Tax=Rhizobium herbae TaxID=508661 RepID=A0ABS4ELM1_9HYPH|nr:SGNH/GDSL hydrolase family protein [Rhizobium herbae]MBP1858851.1 lysophospholipase L1-like esterase [Rhizobium herbae]
MGDIANVFGAGEIALDRAHYAGLSRFHRWKLGFTALRAVPDVMASPPAISVGAAAAASLISGSTVPGCGKDDTRMTRLGGTFEDSGAYKKGSRGGVRYRFIFDGTRFDYRIRSYLGQSSVTLYVDGRPVSKALFSEEHPGLNDDTEHFVLQDFGTDVPTYGLINPAILDAGSGYAVGDVVTLSGGTFITAAQVRVTGVDAGAITAAAIHRAGVYSVAPARTTQGSTTGSGTGATFTTVFGTLNTTKHVRKIEMILGFGVRFGGINVDPGVSVLPWAENTQAAKLLIAGDSITQGFFNTWAGGNWSRQVAYMLGLEERFVQYGTSGRGFLKRTRFSLDTPGIIDLAPDMLVIADGFNDMFQFSSLTGAALKAEITARLDELLKALPKVRIVGISPYYDTTSSKACTAAIAAGYAAAWDKSRVRFYDFAATGAYSASGAFASTDATHPGQSGQDFLAATLAPPIANLFLSMA